MKQIPIRHIKPVTPSQLSAERFSIRRVEDILKGNDLLHALHRHDFYFILAIDHGGGLHEIDFTNYEVKNRSLFFLRPGQVHQLQLKAGSTGFLAEFNNEFYHPADAAASQRLKKASAKNFCVAGKERFAKLLGLLCAIYDEAALQEQGYTDVIKHSLDIFFIELLRQSSTPATALIKASNYYQERFEEFVELLDKNIARHKQVSYYTDVMNLSAYQLNGITKSSVGKPASDLINDHILLEAKRYLLATPSQVKEIADQLGYEDASYFIRFFKKHTGHSPEAFRQHFK